MLILVPDRLYGTNSCKFASGRSKFYAIYVICLYYMSDSRLYTYSILSFFLLCPQKKVDSSYFIIKIAFLWGIYNKKGLGLLGA